MFGNGHESIVFDCNNPSYFDDDNSNVHITGHAINDKIAGKDYADHNYKCKPGSDIDKAEDGSWYYSFLNKNEYVLIDRRKPWESAHGGYQIIVKKTLEDFIRMRYTNSSELISDVIDVYLKIIRHPMYTKNHLNINRKIDLAEVACQRDNEKYQVENRRRNELYAKFKQINSMVDGPRNNSEIFGLCSMYILFNCQQPMFLDSKSTGAGKLEYFTTPAKGVDSFLRNKTSYGCNGRTHIWEDNKGNVMTYRVVDGLVTPISMEIIGLWAYEGICKDAMELFRHPAYVKWHSSTRFQNKNTCADLYHKHQAYKKNGS
jgi:hypothetical protein